MLSACMGFPQHGAQLPQASLPALFHGIRSPLGTVRAIKLNAGSGDLLAALQRVGGRKHQSGRDAAGAAISSRSLFSALIAIADLGTLGALGAHPAGRSRAHSSGESPGCEALHD